MHPLELKKIINKNLVPQIIYFIGGSSAFFKDFACIFLQFLYFQMTLIWNSSLAGKMGWVFILLMVKHRDATHRCLWVNLGWLMQKIHSLGQWIDIKIQNEPSLKICQSSSASFPPPQTHTHTPKCCEPPCPAFVQPTGINQPHFW